MQTRAELYDFLGYHAYEAEARRAVRARTKPRSEHERRHASAARRKPKKSVALSGVAAGNTALCTVGRTGNDLHYRGYDILDIADAVASSRRSPTCWCTASCRTRAELAAYKAQAQARCAACRRPVQAVLERIPAAAHPMDVMRTGVLGARHACCPRRTTTTPPGARDIADRLMASLRLDAAVLVSLQPQRPAHRRRDRRRLDRRALPAPAARQARRRPQWVRAMHTSLILYAEHEFNASTFTARVIAGTGSDMYSAHHRRDRRAARPEARRRQRSRLRDPSSATTRPTKPKPTSARASSDKEIIIGFGHPVYTIADPRNEVIKEVARELSRGRRRHEDVRHRRAHRDGDVATRRRCSRTSTGTAPSSYHMMGVPTRDVHAAVRDRAHLRLGGARHRAARSTARSSGRAPTTPARRTCSSCRSTSDRTET